MRWAHTLRQRETRPLRRGLAVWRRASCLGIPERDEATARALVAQADGGETGSFALANTSAPSLPRACMPVEAASEAEEASRSAVRPVRTRAGAGSSSPTESWHC